MRLETLAYLVDIAETRSISATAGRLFVSQQNISRAIKSLENELDCQLLDRSYTGVSLTPEGAVVVEKAQVILNIMQSIKQDLHNMQPPSASSLQGQLRIVVNHQASNTLMPHILSLFIKEHPRIAVTIATAEAPRIPDLLLAGTYDLALTGISPHTVAPGSDYEAALNALDCEKFYSDTVMICLSPQLHLAHRAILRPADICDLPEISMGHMAPIHQVLFRDTRQPFSILETSSKEQFKHAIAEGLGFGLSNTIDMKLNYSHEEKKRLVFLPLIDEKNDIVYQLLCMPTRKTEPNIAAFAKAVSMFFTSMLRYNINVYLRAIRLMELRIFM